MALTALAQDVEFKASAPAQVIVGKPFQLTYSVNQRAKDLRAPEFTDFDYIAGDCFFVGDDYDNGDFKSLTDEQINEVYDICNKREIINLFELEDSNGKEFE